MIAAANMIRMSVRKKISMRINITAIKKRVSVSNINIGFLLKFVREFKNN